MGADKHNQNNMGQNRQPQQQSGGMSQRNPSQQQQQKGQMGDKSGQRIDTDNDGRTRDASDKRPSDQGGKAPPVQR
jgi:hypothetical protein